jgi:uncharacterized protein (UPF0371 family)
MGSIGFDNDKYLRLQSKHISERIAQFGGKLYLEFGGKLFDDFHASRVLPGFKPDSKLQMLLQLKEDAEVVIVINAGDIEKNKVRGDLGITYDLDVLRLIDAFKSVGLYVGSVVMTRYSEQYSSAACFVNKLESLGVKVYKHYSIKGYPYNIEAIVSEEGYGRNDYIETSRPLVVVTGSEDKIFPVNSAKECVAEGKKVYDALGAGENIIHVIGAQGHRFYADDSWPHINSAIEKL